MPDPTISIAACAALERALNFTIGLDERLSRAMAAQQGKLVRLYAQDPAFEIFIELGERCRVLYHSRATPDVALGGSLTAWLALARSADKVAELVNGELTITGDSRILLSLGELAGELDIDWEAQLAEVIGDVPAVLASRTLRNAAQVGGEAAGVARQLLDDFIEQHDRARARQAGPDAIGDGLRALSSGLRKISGGAIYGEPVSKGPALSEPVPGSKRQRKTSTASTATGNREP